MGFIFTLLYIMTGYFSPTLLFGELGTYHLETIIVALALIFSLAQWNRSGLPKMPQSWALAGLCFAVFCSIMFNGLLAYAAGTVLEFLPSVACFFLVVLACRSKARLQILVACIFVFAAFVICQGMFAVQAGDIESPYILDMGSSTEHLLRIRGLGIFNDPNDFSQLIVGLIPCMFFFWRKDRAALNLLLVYLPVAFLVYGMYLTHSRGGMLALMVIAIFAVRRKIGLIPGVIGGALVFIALSAAGFSGGRDVSADAGADRISLWSQGLAIIRSHPLFGVGYNRMPEYTDVGLTAHNTFVVCAAELGLIGVFFWLLMAVSTLRNALALGTAKPADISVDNSADNRADTTILASGIPVARAARGALPEPVFAHAGAAYATASAYKQESKPPGARPTAFGDEPLRIGVLAPDATDPEAEATEIRRMASLTVLSFAGFFTAGWFLSRSYTLALFVNAGIAAAIFQMACERGFAPPQMPLGKLLKVTAITTLVLFIFVYVIVRADHYLPR